MITHTNIHTFLILSRYTFYLGMYPPPVKLENFLIIKINKFFIENTSLNLIKVFMSIYCLPVRQVLGRYHKTGSHAVKISSSAFIEKQLP